MKGFIVTMLGLIWLTLNGMLVSHMPDCTFMQLPIEYVVYTLGILEGLVVVLIGIVILK